MREVEATTFVPEKPAVVERAMDPARIVEFEESFVVRDVTETADATVITVGARGLEFSLRFEPIDGGIAYEQHGDGPLETNRTTITWRSENEGTRVGARSTVAMGRRPAAVFDRLAAWKRRGELRRALENLAEAVE